MKLGRETTATIKASRYVVVRMEGKTYTRARDPSGAAAQYAAGNPGGRAKPMIWLRIVSLVSLFPTVQAQ